MKKTTKYIIITLVVLIVLGAAAAALILTSPKDSEDDANSSGTVSESTEPTLIDKTAEDVKNIGIEDLAANDSYTIIPTETTTSSGDTEQTFTIEGWDDLDVLYSNVKSLADRLYSITPTKKIGADRGPLRVRSRQRRRLQDHHELHGRHVPDVHHRQ